MNIKTNAYLDQALAILKDGWDSGKKKEGMEKTADFVSNLFIQAHPEWGDSVDYLDWSIKEMEKYERKTGYQDDPLERWMGALDDRSRIKKWLVQDPDYGEDISVFDYDDEIEYNALWTDIEEAIKDKLDKTGTGRTPASTGIVKSILLFPFLLVSWLLKLAVLLGIAGIIVWLICTLTE